MTHLDRVAFTCGLVVLAALAGCATTRVEPMEACGELNWPTPIKAESLDTALRRATTWAEKNYGSDCVVCAQSWGEDERTFGIHVTSPEFGEEMVLNTSALLTFRRSDGHLIEAGKYHSCFVKRVHK